MTSLSLEKRIQNIDGKGYGAYKSLKGDYTFDTYILTIDHVQSDPYAPPSKVHITMNRDISEFPLELSDTPWKQIALEDYITRSFYNCAQSFTQDISISKCGQEILNRTSVDVSPTSIIVRFKVQFPASGRRILGQPFHKIIFNTLPQIVSQSLIYPTSTFTQDLIQSWINLADDQHSLREQIIEHNFVAFIANGSNLPRESGNSDLPRDINQSLPFQAPPSLTVSFTLPHKGAIVGMGIPAGITLIAGGGFHGKSTLLKAIEKGIYNHIPGDGREFVVTNPTAFKIRSEDGRSVVKDDISPFIKNLPWISQSTTSKVVQISRSTCSFSTENASGSTSQAANIVEAIESGSKLLLIDEDTSASNFMTRDLIMSKIIVGDKEPITPFTELIKPLYDIYGISIILIVGSSASYIPYSNTIIQMDSYTPIEITTQAKQAFFEVYPDFPLQNNENIKENNNQNINENNNPLWSRESERKVERGLISLIDKVKIKAIELDSLIINKLMIDLRYVEQLVDSEQLRTLGFIIEYIEKNLAGKGLNISQIGDVMMQEIQTKGLSFLTSGNNFWENLAIIRKQDLLACLNRMRTLKINQQFK